MRINGCDSNLVLLTIYYKSDRLAMFLLLLDNLLIFYPAILIFLNPFSAFAWFAALIIDDDHNTTAQLRHDTDHNIIWYSEFVILPLIVVTTVSLAITIRLMLYARSIFSSPDPDFYVLAKLDKPSFCVPIDDNPQITVDEIFNNKNLYSTLCRDQFILIRNSIFNPGQKIYSKLHLAVAANNIPVVAIYSRFNLSIIHLFYALHVHKMSCELINELIEMLGIEYVANRLKNNSNIEINPVYKTKHADKVVTRRNNKTYITTENIEFMLQGYKNYRIANYYRTLEPQAEMVREDDVENQFTSLRRPLLS